MAVSGDCTRSGRATVRGTGEVAADTTMAPVHPGEILLEEFLTPLGVSQYQLAKAVDVPARRINEIVRGQRRITGPAS